MIKHEVDISALQAFHISIIVYSPILCEGTPVARCMGFSFSRDFFVLTNFESFCLFTLQLSLLYLFSSICFCFFQVTARFFSRHHLVTN